MEARRRAGSCAILPVSGNGQADPEEALEGAKVPGTGRDAGLNHGVGRNAGPAHVKACLSRQLSNEFALGPAVSFPEGVNKF